MRLIIKYIFLSGVFSFFSLILLAQKTEVVYLSGTGNDNTVDWEFFCTEGMNSGKWTTIPVPSNWELQGFGAYNYGYDKAVGRASEKGLYKYTFNVPENWKGKVINIVFEGSMTDTEVKINGKLAGPIHQGAFYRFKYDISRLLKFGSGNLLEVIVSKISSNESVNKAEREADYWVFGGIFRPVYLEALPKSHIREVEINAGANGDFTAKVYLEGSKKNYNLSVQLYTLSGERVGDSLSIATGGNDLISLKSKFNNLKPWTPETPTLYKAVFTLSGEGKNQHVYVQNIGFRTIELRERDGIYLNGVKIKFKGVNRHSFFPSSGRTLSKNLTIDDVKLIKDMNMNAIRNSHYPADGHFYDVCDSMGIMVLDELAGWHDAYDTKVGSGLVKEMMQVSMNHPCVVMWVNGNEGGHNHELLPLYDSMDMQKRPVVHAWEIFRGLDTQHYRDYDYGVGSHFHGHNVFMPTEFLHGMNDGGGGSGLEDFWNLMWYNPLSAGGFLWDFADEAVVRTDKNRKLDSDGNHGSDGILGPYREKEGSYFTIKEVWSPVFFEHREITPAFDGTFVLENRYHFTNLNQCSFKWELIKYSLSGSGNQTLKISGIVSAPNINPGEKGILKLLLPENWKQYDVLYITVFDPRQNELFTWSWPVSLPQTIAERIIEKAGLKQIEINETEAVLNVLSNGVSIDFDKNSGMLLGVKNSKGNISLTNGPVLCEGESTLKKLIHYSDSGNLFVDAQFEDKSVFRSLKWTIYPSGWLKLDVVYSPVVERHDLLGISFSYPENMVKSIRWMGDGPYRVWKNRIKGNKLGVWEKEYNNTITGQSEFIYPEFKGFHSRMYWLTVNTKEQPFTVVCPDEDIFFRMFTPVTPDDPYDTAPLFPSGDISFLHGITAMGSKNLQSYRMGTMSDKNIYYSYEGARPLKMTLYFDFRAK